MNSRHNMNKGLHDTFVMGGIISSWCLELLKQLIDATLWADVLPFAHVIVYCNVNVGFKVVP